MKKLLIIGSAFIFITIVIFISSLFMTDDTLSHNGHIPDNVGPYVLINKIEGEEAKPHLNKFLGQDVKLDDAYVLEYQTQSGSYALVWISESHEPGVTKKLLDDMKQFVQKNPGYSNYSEETINDKTVQYTSGMERDNYYFEGENRFVWVATYEDKRDIFIKNAVKIFSQSTHEEDHEQ